MTYPKARAWLPSISSIFKYIVSTPTKTSPRSKYVVTSLAFWVLGIWLDGHYRKAPFRWDTFREHIKPKSSFKNQEWPETKIVFCFCSITFSSFLVLRLVPGLGNFELSSQIPRSGTYLFIWDILGESYKGLPNQNVYNHF